MTEAPFQDLDGRTQAWLRYEQTVNERLWRFEGPAQLLSDRSIREGCRPERQPAWRQEVVWLPPDRVRGYGPFRAALGTLLGAPDDGRCPLLLHPQPPAGHRRLSRAYGRARLDDVWATPTASHRSVLAWRRGQAPVVLKLSLGAVVGRTRRSLSEAQVASGVLISALLDTIPAADRERLGLDWFPEPAGVVETESGHGWLLRRLPATVTRTADRGLVPAFSLVSRRGADPPLLVDLIRGAGLRAEEFVVERLVRPYVAALSYLLLDQGIQVEGHVQNVLFETDGREQLTGRLVLRDLSDATVSIPLRLARGKPLPRLAHGLFPVRTPFPLATVAADHRTCGRRPRLLRARDTVERYGMSGFLWPVSQSLARFFPGYDAGAVEQRYLELWQDAVVRHLNVKPLFRESPRGLATDEALAHFLLHVDWRALGATGGACLYGQAEPLRIEEGIRRRAGPAYRRLHCAWGDLYLDGGLPAFFRPAF